jgi:cytidine diphosphoramidate kinase
MNTRTARAAGVMECGSGDCDPDAGPRDSTLTAAAAVPLGPRVVWITGLSGAGKSTIAREVVGLLHGAGQPAILLDGDEVRAAIDDPHIGHDRPSRLANALRICRLARLLAGQGFPVVVATMSLFKEVHQWNRAHLPAYLEVFVKVSLDTLRARDARGLYSRAEAGMAQNVVGVHLDYDEPQSPDLVVVNEGAPGTVQARQIVDCLNRPAT